MNGKDRMGQSDNSSLRLEKDHPNLLNMRFCFCWCIQDTKKLSRLSNLYTIAKQ